jgi:hypothetical protein
VSSLHGSCLASAIDARFGVRSPSDDPLAVVRARIDEAVDVYYRDAGRHTDADHMLEQAVAALRADPVALASREQNLSALGYATFVRARIALERGDSWAARELLRGLIERNPALLPDEREVPPSIGALYRQVTAELSGAPGAAVQVASPGSVGCGVLVDGVASGIAPTLVGRLTPGTHLVALRCDDRPSRWHSVRAEVGRVAAVSIDWALDRVVGSLGSSGVLVYANQAQADARMAHDAVALGAALEAHRVVVVGSDRLVAVDVPALESVDAGRQPLAPSSQVLHRPPF